MHRVKLYILLLITAILCTNCSPKKVANKIQNGVKIEAVENIEGSLSGGWVVTLRIKNDTGYQPTLQSAEADIFMEGAQVIHASLRSPVTLPKKEVASIGIPLDISIKNPLKAFSLIMQFSNRNFEGIELSLVSTVEVMGIKRSIIIDKSPINQILTKLGYTAQ